MYLESYRHLIEIDALKRANESNLLNVHSEKKRISVLELKKLQFLEEIESIKIEISSLRLSELEREINDLQKSLSRQLDQLNLVTTQKEQITLEQQIAELKNKLNSQEETYFEKLELSESLEEKIKNHQTFLIGSVETIRDIQAEVDLTLAKEEKIILDRQGRINALFEQMDASLKSLYLEVEKRFLPPKKPVSYLLTKKCSECHMQVDTTLRASLEEGRSIELCPHCSRLLIPETAKIY